MCESIRSTIMRPGRTRQWRVLAVIDPVNRKLLVDIVLKGHPESFQIAQDGQHIFLNIPDDGEIAVIDSLHNRQQAI